jgi:hypothetical protein
MPGIRECHVVERKPLGRRGERLVVEQKGEFRFLLFAQSMAVVLNIEHQPLRVADAKALSFDLGLLKRRAIDVFEGRYELAPLKPRRGTPRTQLRYTSLIGLHLPPPPAIGSLAVRKNLTAQLDAVAQEVARRASLAAAAPGRRRGLSPDPA